MDRTTAWSLERWLIVLIAAHSAAVGVGLLFLPGIALPMVGWDVVGWGGAGWGEVTPLFFVRQAGIFHFIVAFGYLHEHVRYRGVTFLVLTKTTALVFLLTLWLTSDVPWTTPVFGVLDGAMGAVVYWLHHR